MDGRVYAVWAVRCCVVLLALGVGFLGSSRILVAQQDLGRDALLKKEYPWYNVETDQAQGVELNRRPEVQSKNRNAIPLRPITKNTSNGTNWNWGGSSSFFGGVSVLVWAAVGIVISLIAGVLLWAFLRLETNQPSADIDLVRRRSMADSIKQLPFDLESQTGDFRQAAHQHYLAGEYGTAMIFLFSHVLVLLDQNGSLRLRKGKTNRQYLRELRSKQPLADYYQRVMVPFEATFFGNKELGQAEFEACWNRLPEFQSEVERTSQVSYG